MLLLLPATAMLLPSSSICFSTSPQTLHAFMHASFFIHTYSIYMIIVHLLKYANVCGCVLSCGFQRREQRRMAITVPFILPVLLYTSNDLIRCHNCAVNKTTCFPLPHLFFPRSTPTIPTLAIPLTLK